MQKAQQVGLLGGAFAARQPMQSGERLTRHSKRCVAGGCERSKVALVGVKSL
jgi:hypothetical protein